MKVNRRGQATILTPVDIVKIREALEHPYKLAWDIANYTGERWGSIVQLHQSDCFDDRGRPLEEITYRSETRKQAAGKKAETRQIPIHDNLRISLLTYPLPKSLWLFPSPVNPDDHIKFDTCDKYFRLALKKTKLTGLGYSLHSTRRTWITNLYRAGVNLRDLMKLSGHKSISSLMLYIEADPEKAKQAIALLP